MADQRIQFTELMVGAGHPTKADTLNRLALVGHNTDGSHKAWVDVKEAYGAVGDGVTDDTTAISDALANARQIIFPYGTYLITGDTLAGVSGQTLHFMPGAVLKLATTAGSKTLLNFVGKETISLINPTFDLNQAGAISNIALKMDGSANVVVENPTIINSAATRSFPATAYGYGIYLLGAWENVRVINPHITDIMYGVITHPSSTGKRLTVSKGLMEYLEGDGVEINVSTGTATEIEVEGVTFHKIGSGTSFARGFGVGISNGENITVHDNFFIDMVFQGVHIEDGSKNVDVHDNYFDNCGLSTQDWTYNNAVYCAATTAGKEISNVKVRGNIINTMGSKSNYGICFVGSVDLTNFEISGNYLNMNGADPTGGVSKGITTGSTAKYGQICNNTVINAKGPGMFIRSSYCVVKGNICYDDQGIKTQTYGIEYTDGANYTIFEGNILAGNATGAFLETSVPDGARFINNIEAADQLVGFAVKSSVANTVGSYKIDGPIAYGQRRAVADAAYSMSRYDSYIAYTSLTAGRQVTIPVTNIQAGHEVVIKDEAGAAGTYNILIVPNSGTIDGAASVAISANYGLKRLRWNGTTWFTV